MSVDLIKDDLEIIGILKGLCNSKSKLWCWQDIFMMMELKKELFTM